MANVRPLPPALAEAARQELHEDPGRLQADLQHLKDWLAKQPHLRARTDDQFLVAFLRGAKFSLERTKEKLDAYYTLRSALPMFFADRDPVTPESIALMKLGVLVPMGDAARRVMLLRAGAFDAARVHVEDIFAMAMRLTDVLLAEDANGAGQDTVVDLAGVTVAHAAQYSPLLVKRVLTYYQEGYPGRPKGIHYLNVRPGIETVMNMFKVVLKEKIRKRIHIHPDLQSLHASIPKEILPLEYGGGAGPLQDAADAWAQKLESWRQYFAEDAQFGCDESKRPGKPKTHQDLFGLEGSFRQLVVD